MNETLPRNRLPVIEMAERGALCPYCGRDDFVFSFREADQWTACVRCIILVFDLLLEWPLSRVVENNLAIQEAAKRMPPRQRL